MLNKQTLLLNMWNIFTKSKKKLGISSLVFINVVRIPIHIITIILEIVLLVKTDGLQFRFPVGYVNLLLNWKYTIGIYIGSINIFNISKIVYQKHKSWNKNITFFRKHKISSFWITIKKYAIFSRILTKYVFWTRHCIIKN